MNIHSLLEIFKNVDVNEMQYRVNHNMGSIWFSEKLDPNDNTRVHVRVTEEYSVLRLYYTDENDTDYRLTYQRETDKLRYSHVPKNTLDLEEAIVEHALSFTSEEHMFQESLITDLGGFEFGDISIIKRLFDDALKIAKTVIIREIE